MAITNYAESWLDQYTKQLPTVNFVSGDYTSLRECIRQYVTSQCPEDYNDWANSSASLSPNKQYAFSNEASANKYDAASASIPFTSV